MWGVNVKEFVLTFLPGVVAGYVLAASYARLGAPITAEPRRLAATARSAHGSSLHRAAADGKHVAATRPRFIDLTKAVGLDFRYRQFITGEFWLPEAMGGGVAWLDYDGDGWLDLFFTQGAPIGPRAGEPAPTDVLYRNLCGERLARVPTDSAPADRAYGMGVAVGDVDNDGFPDLYITNYGPDALYLNNGDGTFCRVESWGTADNALWGASAALADLDLDGDLDLYVTNYLSFDPKQRCYRPPQHQLGYCGPTLFPPQRDVLLENDGRGRFVDRSEASGIAYHAGRGLGVVVADLVGDEFPEIFVGNDMMENFLFVRQHNSRLRYEEQALLLGLAYDANGQAQADMGIACGDIDNDGDLDLYATHFYLEYNTLWINEGGTMFSDRTAAAGLALPTMQPLSWGTHMLDYDGDGWLDLLVVSGHINDFRQHGIPYAMPCQLFANVAGRLNRKLRFVEVTDRAGDYFARLHVGRASAIGDFDRDGRVDVAIVHYHEPAVLLRNETELVGRFIGLVPVGIRSNRSGVGVGVRLNGTRRGRRYSVYRYIPGGGSYQAADAQEIRLYLPPDLVPEELVVRFPGGRIVRVPAPQAGHYYRLSEAGDVQILATFHRSRIPSAAGQIGGPSAGGTSD